MAISDFLKGRLRGQIDELLKAEGVGDTLPDVPQDIQEDNQIRQKAIIDDPFFDYTGGAGSIYKQKQSRLTNKTLKDVSLRDWVVSAIIQARCDTLLRFSRPSEKNLDAGYRFVKRDQRTNQQFTKEEKEEIHALEQFLYNCGRIEGTPHDDRMLFGEFLKLCTRDAITFGHVAIEKVKTRGGGLHRFRPLPAESVYIINKKVSKEMIAKEVRNAQTNYQPGDNDPRKEQVINEADIEYYKYVQMSYDNRVLSAFGDEDMIFKVFNVQNFADSQGYGYSPLELAIINITNHMNVENYNANFFTQGYAARGILHLKGVVTQSHLTSFRRQFYNTISGTQHAWRTPIIAGLEEVQWVPMSGSAREMEYINFNNHLMRALCAQFQIDPMELGLDYLISGTGKAPSQQANNEYKIEYSRERGLYPIMMFFEDMINCDILPAIDPELAKKYQFKFTGYTDESPQTVIAQLQAEMTVHSSMNDLMFAAEKTGLKTPAADLPLNAAFWAIVEKNYTRGEIREKFFGDVGATSRRELQYIPGDPAFMGWQQLLLTIDRSRKQDEQMKAQMALQQAAQSHEQEMAMADHQRQQEAHDLGMQQAKEQAARNVVMAGNTDSMQDIAKMYGAGNKPLNIGGQTVGNPINKSEDPENN